MNQLSIIAALALLAGSAVAQPTIEYLPAGYIVTDISSNGEVAAGNVLLDGSYETFRWTSASGVQRLGRASVPVIGRGAGTPDVSHDGNRISASIISTNNKLTQGLWDITTGWTETMPPLPLDGLDVDESYGSAWGLSGDGVTLSGFYWNTTVDAQACTWNGEGITALSQIPGRSARANAVNGNGSVVVGWEEEATGEWQPRAWRNGVKVILDAGEAFAEAQGVNSEGTIIVGETYDPMSATVVGSIWRWNGLSYDVQRVGTLPGTQQVAGFSSLESVSDDGRIAVGFNRFNNSPQSAGMVWTPETGLMKGEDYLATLGLSVGAGNTIVSFSSVSPDGTAFTGMIQQILSGALQSFIVHVPPVECAGDTNGDNAVNGADLSVLLSQFGQSVTPGTGADLNDDGVVNGADLSVLLSSFGSGC